MDPSPGEGARSHGGWPPVAALGLATFGVVTTEMLPVGLLTPIADSLSMSTGQAGLMLSVPAILAAIAAPLVVVHAAGTDRRTLLGWLLAALAAANLLCASATSLAWLLTARALVGLCMGGIWAIAAGLAPRLVAPAAVGWANALIFGGVSVASVAGVPLGAWLGDLFGWRAAFGAMAVVSCAVLALNLLCLPRLPGRAGAAARATGSRALRDQLARRPVQLGLILTALIVAGHFMAYTYVRPLLQHQSGFGATSIGPLLAGYGIASMLANFVAGPIAARRPAASLFAVALALCATLLGLALAGDARIAALLLLLAWGVSYGAVSVSLQSWMLHASPQGVEAATALMVAVFNLGIASGSYLGGIGVDGIGVPLTYGFASALAGAAALLALWMARGGGASNGLAPPAHARDCRA